VRRNRVHGRVPHIGPRLSVTELPRQDKSSLSLLASLATLAIPVFLATGCDQIGAQASKAVEQRVQQETGDLMEKAIGSIDKTISSVGSQLSKNGSKLQVVSDGSLQPAGVSPTSVAIREAPERMAAVYCTFEKALDSTLEARFLNAAGAEIGRVQQRVTAKAGAGQFIEFSIDPRTNIQEIVMVRVRKP